MGVLRRELPETRSKTAGAKELATVAFIPFLLFYFMCYTGKFLHTL